MRTFQNSVIYFLVGLMETEDLNSVYIPLWVFQIHVQNHNSSLRVRFNSVFCFSAQLLLHFVLFSKSQLTLLIFIPPSVLSDYIDSALTLSCASAFFYYYCCYCTGRQKSGEVIGFWTRPAIFLCKGDGAALLRFVTQKATNIFAEGKTEGAF
jgi:hypothetical protein